MAFGLSGFRDQKKRLLVKLLLVVIVHVSMIFLGNENATPQKLLLSFVVTSLLVLVSDRIRAKLVAPVPATSSTPPESTP